MQMKYQNNRNRTLGIESLEDRALMAGNLIGVAWDFEDSPVYRIDGTTGAADLIG